MSAPSNLPEIVKPQRLASIDIVRGAVIVLMMFDHTRDFVHREGMTGDPCDLTCTNAGLFITRFVTHFCAPVFVFFAGVSARIQLNRGRSRADLSRFLWQRGLFLIALELMVLRPSIWFNLDYSLLAHLQVIWVIGWSMIVLAGLVWLPYWATGLFGGVLVLGHNLLDGIQLGFPATTVSESLWAIVHQKTAFVIGGEDGPIVFVQYPLVPWVGVMALGYVAGVIFQLESARRRQLLARWGLGLIAAFVALRTNNLYGDPQPWDFYPEGTPTNLSTWEWALFSFVNTEKYPPSLLFLLMTIGPMFIALAKLEGRNPGWIGRRLQTLGSVPLFFYLLQWPTVHLISKFLQWFAGQQVGWDSINPLDVGPNPPANQGFGLGTVYLAWILGTVALYPI